MVGAKQMLDGRLSFFRFSLSFVAVFIKVVHRRRSIGERRPHNLNRK